MNLIGQDRHQSNRWSDEIYRCLLTSSVPENAAAAAAAAAWMIVGKADSATVVLFTSTSGFVMASGRRDAADRIEISVDSGQHSIGALFDIDQIKAFVADSTTLSNATTHIWPERLAACLVEGREHESTPAANIAAEILSKAQTQQTRIPNADHMESMAEFAAGAGHEINNPLGSIIGQTQLLLKQEQQTERRQALATIGSQAWRIRDMIGDCMLFARPPAPERQDCELGDLVRQASSNAATALDQSPDDLEFDLPAMPLTMSADPSQLQTLVTHLVRNAVESCLNAELPVHVSIAVKTESKAVILTVGDRGPGIIEDKLRRHLFDPFFSGRQAGRGIGFGLPACWQIARNHGGLILQESPDDGGAQFVVALPGSR